MTTENSPAQKSFDVNKYKINIADRELVDVEVGEDKFQVEIKPLSWFKYRDGDLPFNEFEFIWRVNNGHIEQTNASI